MLSFLSLSRTFLVKIEQSVLMSTSSSGYTHLFQTKKEFKKTKRVELTLLTNRCTRSRLKYAKLKQAGPFAEHYINQ